MSDERTRVAVICSTQQRAILKTAAEASGSDLSAWILAHAMRAAGAQNGAAPVMLAGPVADRLRAAAQRQGITPERAIELLLIAGES